MSKKKEQFILGSGKLFVMEYDGAAIPEDAEIEIEANRAGQISGGATLEYKPTYVAVSDDLGEVKKSILSAEDVTFKSGMLVKNMDFLGFAAPTARDGTVSASKKKTTKIGGVKNASGKTYLVRFLHVSTHSPDYALRITIVGTMTDGFSLAFAKDKETIPDLTFAAEPLDDVGTLVQIDEPGESEAPSA